MSDTRPFECPKCRTIDIDSCHSMTCPVRKSSPIEAKTQEKKRKHESIYNLENPPGGPSLPTSALHRTDEEKTLTRNISISVLETLRKRLSRRITQDIHAVECEEIDQLISEIKSNTGTSVPESHKTQEIQEVEEYRQFLIDFRDNLQKTNVFYCNQGMINEINKFLTRRNP